MARQIALQILKKKTSRRVLADKEKPNFGFFLAPSNIFNTHTYVR